MNFAGTESFSPDLVNGVAEANGKQGLATILKNVDYPLRGIFQKDVSAVRKQVVFGAGCDGLDQALTEFFLEESDDRLFP